MSDLEELTKFVEQYESTYRGANLEPFQFVERYDLNSGMPCPPLAAKRGIYAIFSDEQLLYIGKSSAKKKAIWHRIVDHFRLGMKTKPTAKWSATPTHFVAWAVPDDSFFEASALEEFLIDRMKDKLPDNRVGK